MPENNSFNFKKWVSHHITSVAAYGGLVVCLIVFSVVPPFFGESLWSAEKFSALMANVIVTALLSVGAVFVYSLGHMDISIGAQVRVYALLMVLLGNATGSLLPGILVSLAIALLVAVINGSAGQLLKIFPIIPSLVFMMVFQGISGIVYTNLNTRSIFLKTIDYRIFKEPWLMIVALVIETLVVSYLFYYTKIGKNSRAIGANEVSAEQNGVDLLKYKVLPYVILSVCVVLASVFQMGYTGAASDATGTGFEMNVMVALILGGMPLAGGMKSRISCAIIGSFTYSLLAVGLPIMGVPNNATFIIKAILFIVVVLITCRKKYGTLPR
ncbi:MAG: ABC transporter permease [Oscillospiraceae bacterium]|nr:ABC transporter permease [Paludibacteraceae bacterium]MBR4472157.1 ABC transporter permease [Oscillospiraceae bacterium]